MIDIETHSTQTFAAPACIAAASFDPRGKSIISAFYRNIDPASCEELGLHFDPTVAEWWTKQDEKIRNDMLIDQKPIKDVLSSFKDWYFKTSSSNIWSQGASFDIPIMANAYAMVGKKPPWHFMSVRDTRTIYDIAEFDTSLVPRKNKHDAISDVLYQVACVQGSYAKLDVERGR